MHTDRFLRIPAIYRALEWATGLHTAPASRRPLNLLTWFVAGIAALALLPSGYLVLRALGTDADELADLLDGRTLTVIGNSVALVSAVTVTAALIGVPFAWLITRTNLPFRRLWLIGGALPLVIPSYIGALTYIAAFGPRGLLQQALAPLGVVALPSIYGFFGAWGTLTLFTYPYVLLNVRSALLNMDPALEETAHSLGVGPGAVFRRLTLPQLRPALAGGMLFAALYTLGDFGAVSLMRYNAFTRAIFLQYTGSFDRHRAAVLSLVLAGLTLSLLILEQRANLRRNYRAGGAGAPRPIRPIALRGWKFPALLFCGSVVALGLLTPVGVLIAWMFQGIRAGMPFLADSLFRPLLNGIGISAATAVAVSLLAVPLAILTVRSPSALHRWLVNLTYLNSGLPGLVVALALVFFAANLLPELYQSFPILVYGYAVRFLPLGISAVRSTLGQITPRYEEAARSLGLRPWQVTMRITAPLVRTGALGGMALVFLSVMKELPITILLAPTGFETLATKIWTAQNEAAFTQIGAPALLLIVASALSLPLILEMHLSR